MKSLITTIVVAGTATTLRWHSPLYTKRIQQHDQTSIISATGIVSSRKYARGVFAHKGEDYSYNIKAQFKETEGTGTRDEGLGVVGRPCTFEFAKQQSTSPVGGP